MKTKLSYHLQFGELIRYRRILLGLSLEELALPCGLDRARLSRIERGNYPPPPLPQLKKMAELLQIPDPSEEFSRMVNMAMEGRLSSPKLKSSKGKGQQVKIHTFHLPTRATPKPEVVRIKENPQQVYDLETAAQRAMQNIGLEGASVVSARLLVRDTKGHEWEYDVLLSADRRRSIVPVRQDKRKFQQRQLKRKR
jgi:transcriptional regulator with XRE-family HTH domain